MHSKTKHIPIKYHYVREQVSQKNIKLEYVGTKEKIDDIFTKPLPHEAFEYLCQKLGILPSSHQIFVIQKIKGEWMCVQVLLVSVSSSLYQRSNPLVAFHIRCPAQSTAFHQEHGSSDNSGLFYSFPHVLYLLAHFYSSRSFTITFCLQNLQKSFLEFHCHQVQGFFRVSSKKVSKCLITFNKHMRRFQYQQIL